MTYLKPFPRRNFSLNFLFSACNANLAFAVATVTALLTVSFLPVAANLSANNELDAENNENNDKNISLSLQNGKVSSIDLVLIIFTQRDFNFELALAQRLQNRVEERASAAAINVSVIQTHERYPEVIGSWAYWPLLQRLSTDFPTPPKWFLFAEPYTSIGDVVELIKHVNEQYNDGRNNLWFIGRALQDKEPTIIHHYWNQAENAPNGQFFYPDSGTGFLLSGKLLTKLAETQKIGYIKRPTDFSIDPNFEFARFVLEATNVALTDDPRFCVFHADTNCLTRFVMPELQQQVSPRGGIFDAYIAVKTHSANHKTRVAVVQRTWAKAVPGGAHQMGFFSDVEDPDVPTISIGVSNVEKGHCEKTLRILRHFLIGGNSGNNSTDNEHPHSPMFHWLFVLDDDTLVSVHRLRRLIALLPSTATEVPSPKVIVGERYGYGFGEDGRSGYDYPTGGAGMLFSRLAVEELVRECKCPRVDSPDDMIIGHCAAQLSIPVLHFDGFHQARPRDYAQLHLDSRLPRHISFHRHGETDPYSDYADFLQEPHEIFVLEPETEEPEKFDQRIGESEEYQKIEL